MRTTTVNLAGKGVEVDEEGFLENRAEWTEEMAQEMARADGIELTPDRWVVIYSVREYYDENRIVPAMCVLTKAVVDKAAATSIRRLTDNGIRKYLYKLFPHRYEREALHEVSQKFTTKYLYELFPQGPGKSARKYAGLPKLTYETDAYGFLENRTDWTEEVAEAMAKADGLELTPDHWVVINFMRAYYDEHQIHPPVRAVIKEMGKKLGPEKGNAKYLFKLFPTSNPFRLQRVSRYAGLPRIVGII